MFAEPVFPSFTFVLSLHTCFVSLRANLFTFCGTVSKYNYLFLLLMISCQFVPHFWWKQSWFACRTDSLSEWPSESDMWLCCNDAPFCICITIGKLWRSIICCWSISFYLDYTSLLGRIFGFLVHPFLFSWQNGTQVHGKFAPGPVLENQINESQNIENNGESTGNYLHWDWKNLKKRWLISCTLHAIGNMLFPSNLIIHIKMKGYSLLVQLLSNSWQVRTLELPVRAMNWRQTINSPSCLLVVSGTPDCENINLPIFVIILWSELGHKPKKKRKRKKLFSIGYLCAKRQNHFHQKQFTSFSLNAFSQVPSVFPKPKLSSSYFPVYLESTESSTFIYYSVSFAIQNTPSFLWFQIAIFEYYTLDLTASNLLVANLHLRNNSGT